MDWAKKTRRNYLADLERSNIGRNQVKVVTDFASAGLGSYGGELTVEILTFVICTSFELEVPQALKDLNVVPSQSPDLKPILEKGFVPVPERKKTKRRSKMELRMPGAEPAKQRAHNLRDINQAPRFERQIPWEHEQKRPEASFKLYVDVIAGKVGSIAQNSDYVSRAFQLLVSSGLFAVNGLTELTWWSDGCGKHFKVLPL
jgi:hypothetical protein